MGAWSPALPTLGYKTLVPGQDLDETLTPYGDNFMRNDKGIVLSYSMNHQANQTLCRIRIDYKYGVYSTGIAWNDDNVTCSLSDDCKSASGPYSCTVTIANKTK